MTFDLCLSILYISYVTLFLCISMSVSLCHKVRKLWLIYLLIFWSSISIVSISGNIYSAQQNLTLHTNTCINMKSCWSRKKFSCNSNCNPCNLSIVSVTYLLFQRPRNQQSFFYVWLVVRNPIFWIWDSPST